MAKLRKIKPIKPLKRKRKKRVLTKKDIPSSKIEKEFMKWLKEELHLSVEDQFQIAYKWYDFRIRTTKILIEFDGDYYHCNPEVYPDGPVDRLQKKAILNDKYKTALAESEGYTVIRVWEKDFKKNKGEVKKKILQEVKDYHKKK
jgi:very-short-patch-repair endonuclease